jgi:hypothetical protein
MNTISPVVNIAVPIRIPANGFPLILRPRLSTYIPIVTKNNQNKTYPNANAMYLTGMTAFMYNFRVPCGIFHNLVPSSKRSCP